MVYDTNVFIDAMRDAARNEEFSRSRAAAAPYEHLSAVVVLELRSGARTPKEIAALQADIFDPFERRGRVFAPSSNAWKRAGEALATLARREGMRLSEMPRSFALDAVLAASCLELGAVLVTSNVRDFSRLERVLPLEFVPAW